MVSFKFSTIYNNIFCDISNDEHVDKLEESNFYDLNVSHDSLNSKYKNLDSNFRNLSVKSKNDKNINVNKLNVKYIIISEHSRIKNFGENKIKF